MIGPARVRSERCRPVPGGQYRGQARLPSALDLVIEDYRVQCWLYERLGQTTEPLAELSALLVDLDGSTLHHDWLLYRERCIRVLEFRIDILERLLKAGARQVDLVRAGKSLVAAVGQFSTLSAQIDRRLRQLWARLPQGVDWTEFETDDPC